MDKTEVRVEVADGDLAEVLVSGPLDMTSRDVLENGVNGAINDGARKILFDLRGVEHLDSTAIASLVHTRDRLGRGDVVAVVCHDDKRRIFHTARLERALNVSGSRDQALAALAAA